MLYFPVLECWIVWSVWLPSCSSWVIPMQMWDHLVHQPPPCRESSPPSCPSLPLLPVWMYISSLTPWLSEFHAVQFSGRSGLGFFCLFLRFYLFIFRQRGREREGEGEKHQCAVASQVPPTEDLACNPGMCLDQELNQ